ncbi:phage major capsid protein [Bosea sp. Root670]|uniref:phage major capsid protein n=1 Tax=Bosea sp. Root670 TaxID=1736583 RepID=UPI000AFFDB9E|nr:phage major capsid protein [Bosea sp. Root670]
MKIGYLFAGLALAALAAVCLFPSVGDGVHHLATAYSHPATMAMGMMGASFRGVSLARADAGDANKILNELKTTFEQFKAAHEEELKGIKKNFADVVTTEKVEKINAQITDLTKALDAVNVALAAAKVGGGGSGALDPAKAEHAQAFEKFFRKGADAGLRDLEVKAKLTTQSDPDGGYLVPEETSATIDRVLGLISVMRQLATVMPVGTSTYKKIVSMGGAGAGWVGEEDTRPETGTPTLRELSFNTMELYANPATTQTMLDDGIIDIAAWLSDEVQIAFAEQEGSAFIAGNGVKRPRGLLAYDTVANGSWSWGKLGYVVSGAAADFATPSTTVSAVDAFIDLYYALKAGYRGNASWLMSDAVMAKVRKFKDGDGAYIWAPPTDSAAVATILGKPVFNDDNMPGVGADAFPVAFGDFRRGYLIVDRMGVRVLRDPFTNKPYVHFYTTKRVGGGVSNFEAIKLMKIASS